MRVIGVSSTNNVNHNERKIMKNGIRSKSSAGKAARRAVTAVVVASVIAGAAGIMAGQGSAAPAGYGGYPSKSAKFKTPKLKHGVLTIKGT